MPHLVSNIGMRLEGLSPLTVANVKSPSAKLLTWTPNHSIWFDYVWESGLWCLLSPLFPHIIPFEGDMVGDQGLNQNITMFILSHMAPIIPNTRLHLGFPPQMNYWSFPLCFLTTLLCAALGFHWKVRSSFYNSFVNYLSHGGLQRAYCTGYRFWLGQLMKFCLNCHLYDDFFWTHVRMQSSILEKLAASK